jgi:hypothetical protein
MTAPFLKELHCGFPNEPAAMISDTLSTLHARGGARQASAFAAMPGASSGARAAHDLLERDHMQRPRLVIRQHSGHALDEQARPALDRSRLDFSSIRQELAGEREKRKPSPRRKCALAGEQAGPDFTD